MNVDYKKWFRLTALGCLAWLTMICAVVAGEAPSAQTKFQEETVRWPQQSALLAFGVILLAVSAVMVPVVPLRRVAGLSNKPRGGSRHNGGNGNNGHDQLPDQRAEFRNGTEQICREIIEGAAELIYTHDLQGRFTLINPAGLKFLGYSPQEVVELKVEQVIAPEYRGVFRHMLDTKLAAGETALCELALVTKDGKRRMVEVSSCLIQKNGRPASIHGIARDITERKQAEATAIEGSELLDVLLDNSSDLIYFKDKASRFVHYSKGLVQHFHVDDPEALKGKSDFDFFTKDHAQPAYEDEQEIIRTGNSIVGKLEVETHKDGRTTWAKTTKMPWRDKDGNMIGIVGITTDVTALKEAEDKLDSERGLLRTLLDNVPDAIYFKDRQSRFVHASKSMAEKTFKHVPALRIRQMEHVRGKSGNASDTELLVGLTDFDTFTEEHARPAYDDEQEIIRTGQPIVGKLEKETHPDGSVTWCLTSKMPWRNKTGTIIGTVGISKDITALKQAENELKATHQRLLEASRMAGMAEVATDVLHNVGNVLNSVNVSCSLVIDRVQETSFANLSKIPQLLRENAGHLDEFLTTDARGKHLPDYIGSLSQTCEDQKSFLSHELNRLRSHIDHIKQVVAMQQNYAKVAGVEETIEVTQLVDDALQINADALTRHSVTYNREFESVPPVFVDKHKVLQILVNLIRNAKYAVSDSERRDKQMSLRIRRKGEDRVQIEVADNGVGIAPENLTRIFAHGFTTRKDGHGFGLHSGALAANDLGGSLTVHSDGVGKGATFTLELPLQRNKSTS